MRKEKRHAGMKGQSRMTFYSIQAERPRDRIGAGLHKAPIPIAQDPAAE